jgi:hypothetical protein
MIQFKALLTKELKEAFRDKRAMLSDVSAMMICSTLCLVKGVRA